jgi:hypothetical protein
VDHGVRRDDASWSVSPVRNIVENDECLGRDADDGLDRGACAAVLHRLVDRLQRVHAIGHAELGGEITPS